VLSGLKKKKRLPVPFFLRKDPKFLAEAKKASLDIQYVSGEETEAVVQGLFKIEPAFIVWMKQVLVP
jgi:hypothetical protein